MPGCWRRCCLRPEPRPAASPRPPRPSSGCPRASRWRPGRPTRPPRCSAAAWSAATTSSSRSAPARRSSARWPKPVSRVDAGVNLYRSATPDGWYQMGATLSAGLSLNWVREIMNASWDELYASAGQPGRADDPLFVPHLSGERTPLFRPGAARLLDRAGAGHDRTSLLRSALEGTAFAIRDALDALLADDRPRGCGWPAAAPWPPAWRQLLADVLDAAAVRGGRARGVRPGRGPAGRPRGGPAELRRHPGAAGALGPPGGRAGPGGGRLPRRTPRAVPPRRRRTQTAPRSAGELRCEEQRDSPDR